jgi:lysosomal acid lipase/cholesteryl ester hydrolase
LLRSNDDGAIWTRQSWFQHPEQRIFKLPIYSKLDLKTKTAVMSSVVRILAAVIATYVVHLSLNSCVYCSEFDDISEQVGRSVALLAGQDFKHEKLPSAFREYAMSDDTNEDLGHATHIEMIERAGFDYELHHTISDDGYIVQLTRLVNPLADQSKLKQPPVMLLQGGITDVTIWVFASIAQHHPEKYPRTASDGPMTSWNRSLAFTLANNGFDVWLVCHRGSNERNQGHIDLRNKQQLPGLRRRAEFNESTLAEMSNKQRQQRSMADVLKYWDFTFDEIAAYELPRHIDKVLALTGAQNVTLVPMSWSTIYAPMALAKQPAYQRKIHNAVVLGPIINNRGTNRIMSLFHSSLCNMIPTELGTMLVTELLFTRPFRDLYLMIGARKDWRYAVLLSMITPLAGPSSQFQTLLEPAVYAHIMQPTGYKMIKHYCQIVVAAKSTHFDYGAMQNRQVYGHFSAPDYDLAKVNLGNWMLVSGGNDVLATQKSVKQFMEVIKPKPFEHVFVGGYNHLDLWAGIDNDVKINLPILGFLDNFHLPPQESD